MSNLPRGLERGELARLFPALADTSKEGRTTSVFLACLANVHEFGKALLASIGQRIGTRAKIEPFTEIGFGKTKEDNALRPDGLIVVTVGSRTWRALVEAKVGNNDLHAEQIDSYIDLAQANGIDAVITLSNQFAALPEHHPAKLRPRRSSKVRLFHWSWMYVLTEADLLLSNDNVTDPVQHYLLSELSRFLLHPSAGVKGFEAMPRAWGDLAQQVSAGGAITTSSPEARDVVGAWHQEIRDLTLILSRLVGVPVRLKLSRSHSADNTVRFNDDAATLAATKTLSASLVVPDAAAPLDVCVDFGHRTLAASVRLRAPDDRKSTKARVNWLLRQLQNTPEDDIYVRLFWPGRGPHTQHELSELKRDASVAGSDRAGLQVSSFELCMVRHLGGVFTRSKKFIEEFERAIPEFYEGAVQGLKAWQPQAPQVREGRADAANVTTEALAEEFDSADQSDPSTENGT